MMRVTGPGGQRRRLRQALATGAGFVIVFSLSSLALGAATQIDATSRSLEIRGALAGDYFGRPVVCADLDGDAKEDLVVGADRSTFTPPQRPTLYLFRGSRGYASRDLINLATDQPDAVILGDTGSNNLATALSKGDVNEDGIVDLIMADSTMTASGRIGAGIVYVLFGRPGFFSQPVYDLGAGHWSVRILGAAAGDDTGGRLMFGGMLSEGLACGDVNNDGIDDIAIGAHLADANSRTDSGKVMVVFGRTPFAAGTTIDLATQANVTVLGNETYGELGTAITIGDLNSDGIADLILGEEYGSVGTLTTEGKIFCLWGRTSWPATYNLLTTPANLTITGRAIWDSLGAAVKMADINADGRADLLATAPGWDPAGVSGIDYGAVYGLSGRTAFPSNINLATTSPDFLTTAPANDQSIGDTLSVGDYDGDGRKDFLFSSRDGDRPAFSGEGRTFIVRGRPALPATLDLGAEEADWIVNGGANNFQLGDTVASGDIDGDGADEIMLAAPFLDGNTGRLLIFDFTPVPAAAADWQLFE
ncbi:MAG: hypothetical protein N2111_13205 [Candidatus Sumerlaeaceae bacterium]|nr:hypothetical protein [Candidatus Sumerlaeaceae bacterium]